MSTTISSRPPSLDSTVICSLVKSLYPFQDVDKTSFRQLQGYEDRNFYFTGCLEDGLASNSDTRESREFIFKVSHTTNSYELLEGVNAVMDHLRHKGFCCSYAIENRSGKKIALLSENQLSCGDPWVRTGGRCSQYPVQVLAYIPGDTLDPSQMTPELAFDVGYLAGNIDKALLDFSHPVLKHRTFSCPLWDLRNFVQIKDLAFSSNVMDPQHKMILEATISNFESHVLPLLPSFSQGMLHNDISVHNIIKRRGDEGFGVIDFGDSMHNCHLFELATAIHGFLSVQQAKPSEDDTDHSEAVYGTAPLVAGYNQAFPLSEAELGCLYYAVLARMCVAAVASELNLQADPGNSYLKSVVHRSWRAAEMVYECSKQALD